MFSPSTVSSSTQLLRGLLRGPVGLSGILISQVCQNPSDNKVNEVIYTPGGEVECWGGRHDGDADLGKV